MSFIDDLKIDKYALDKELVTQPELFMVWAEQHADAQEEYELIKLNIERTEADIDSQIRSSPEDFGFTGKITETAITNTIKIQPKIIKLKEDLIKAKKNVTKLQSAKDAMHDKKSVLANLVQLYLSNYFSSTPIQDEDKIEQKAKDNMNNKIRKKLNKKLKQGDE